MTPERFQKLTETLDRRQPDLTLLTEQIHKPRNIAALVRTADAVGMADVHMVWPFDHHKHYKGTAMGSNRWVDVHLHGEMDIAVRELQESGHKVYAAHFSDRSVDFRAVDYTVPTAVVFGNEKSGITESTARIVDEHITVPMVGMVESFNVSVAAGIILSEAQRQRQLAGLYDQVRLPEDRYWHTFFRWAHPKVARYCEQKGLAYPEISRQDGEIINPAQWYAAVRAGEIS